MHALRLSAAALACLLTLGAAAPADTFEDVAKALTDAWNRHKSMTANVKLRMNIPIPGQTGGVVNEGEGTFEWVRKGEKSMHRMEMRNVMVTSVRDQEMRLEQQLVSVFDGETATTLQTQMGRTTAMRNPPDDAQPTSTGDLFTSARPHFEFKLLPDAKVHGAACRVIEATPARPIPRLPARKVVYYINSDTGAIVRFVWLDDKNEEINVTDFLDMKFDAGIDKKRFELEIPEGVTVQERRPGTRP